MDHAEDWDENHHEEEEKVGDAHEGLPNPVECWWEEVDVDKTDKLDYLHVHLRSLHLYNLFIEMVSLYLSGVVADKQTHQYVT